MSILLRQPATVPALFSRTVECDRSPGRPTRGWPRQVRGVPLLAVSGWIAVAVVEVPLVKAAALLGLALTR